MQYALTFDQHVYQPACERLEVTPLFSLVCWHDDDVNDCASRQTDCIPALWHIKHPPHPLTIAVQIH